MFWQIVVPLFVVICLALLAVLSFTPVDTGEVYGLLRLGKYRYALRPGPRWIIPFLDKLKRRSTKVHQSEYPAEPELVAHHDAEVAEGKQIPFRVSQKGMTEALYLRKKTDPNYQYDPDRDPLEAYEKITFDQLPEAVRKSMEADPAHAALTSVIGANVEWYQKDDDASVEQNIANIDDSRMSSEDEIDRRLNDYTDRAIRELLGTITAGHTQENLHVFNEAFRFRLEILVGERKDPATGRFIDKPWGIHIASASIKAGDLGETINRARAAAAAAVSERREKILNSEAEAASIENVANAQANAIRVTADAKEHEEGAKGRGEAARIKAMAKVMKDPNARFIAQLDVAEQALTAKGRTLFVPTQTGMMASILSLSADLAGVQPTDQPNSESSTPAQ